MPFTWPVGMGKGFRGVLDLQRDQMRVFKPGEDRERATATRSSRASTTRRTPSASARSTSTPRHDIELVREAAPRVRRGAFLAGHQTPVFFGSAINNFGVREVLDALVDLAPPPGPKPRDPARRCSPTETKFTGVVFKIQANMDPAHRDRIAFVRVASGHFERGMKLKVTRSGKELQAQHGGELPVAAARAARRGVRRRHHRHPEPRRAAARRHADRRRGAAVHRAAVLRARDVPQRRGGRPAAHQAAARRAAAARRGGRDPGVPPGRRRRAAARRRGPAAVRGGRAPAGARVRLKARMQPSRYPDRALGHLRRPRTAATRSCSASSTATRTASPTTRSMRRRCWSSTRPSCGRSRATGRRSSFHALREHAGLVFQKQLDG